MRRLRTLLRRPNDPEKPVGAGFSILAEELIQEVLKHLRWPTDFYVLSLVSRVLYRHATPGLYSTLVIAYHRPDRVSALLALMETNPEKAILVKTLLFDEDVKSIGPSLPDCGPWPPKAHRRELADGWNPMSANTQSLRNYPHNDHHITIARRLRTILPSLHNLKRVVMRRVHPSYLRPARCDGHFNPSRQISSPGSDARRDDPDIWEYIFQGSSHITEVYVNGCTSAMLTDKMASALTTVCISDLFLDIEEHTTMARTWNAILTNMHNLKTLCMVRVQYAHIILNGRSFPHLQALELYDVFLEDHRALGCRVFVEFIYRHSNTLGTLAISAPVFTSIDHCQWLADENVLPNLHTLRLDHTLLLLVAANEETAWPEIEGDREITRSKKTNILMEFIRSRPSIVDVGISHLKCPEADELARDLVATRAMRHVCIGTAALQSYRSRMPSNLRSWWYGADAWSFYELFGGLTLTRSGHRPELPSQSWKFWK